MKRREIPMSMSLIGILALMLAAATAYAGTPVGVPEPGVFELLAIGGVAAIVIAIRNRRKK